MSYVIHVDNLSKQYHIGGRQERYRTARDMLSATFTAPFKRAQRLLSGNASAAANLNETFWALKNVSFDVEKGEVLGIVGRNGAGKSTLLKILSRITEPTEGLARVKGRMGALLEVGTGFHPELTGRENVYLNGAILGMSRAIIDQKFDQIVAFSGVEKFIDTPIKFYSSGMYLRLAFSVAAHLEPEILVVDEVLAVGDAEFQRKCIGKMNDVAKEGRTVLFVSHNLVAVASLCTKALLLKAGQVATLGAVDEVLTAYQASIGTAANTPLIERRDRRGTGVFRFTNLTINAMDTESGMIESGHGMILTMACQSKTNEPLANLAFRAEIMDSLGNLLFTCHTDLVGGNFAQLPPLAEIVCEIPALPLAPGVYRVNLWGACDGPTADQIQDAGQFMVVEGNFFPNSKLINTNHQGVFLVQQSWNAHEVVPQLSEL